MAKLQGDQTLGFCFLRIYFMAFSLTLVAGTNQKFFEGQIRKLSDPPTSHPKSPMAFLVSTLVRSYEALFL